MPFFGQSPEIFLLGKLLPALTQRTVIDVGAAHGDFARAMLRLGAETVQAIESDPRDLEFLTERFRDEPRVTVHAPPPGDHDKALETPSKPAKMLASLVGASRLGSRVGGLKLRQASDLELVLSLSDLQCDVIVVNKWSENPWLLARAASEGFVHFAFIVSGSGSTSFQWDDDRTPDGTSGTLLLLNERIVADLLLGLLEGVSELGRANVDQVDHLHAAAAELARERDIHAATAFEVSRERDIQAAAAAERLQLIERLTLEATETETETELEPTEP